MTFLFKPLVRAIWHCHFHFKKCVTVLINNPFQYCDLNLKPTGFLTIGLWKHDKPFYQNLIKYFAPQIKAGLIHSCPIYILKLLFNSKIKQTSVNGKHQATRLLILSAFEQLISVLLPMNMKSVDFCLACVGTVVGPVTCSRRKKIKIII